MVLFFCCSSARWCHAILKFGWWVIGRFRMTNTIFFSQGERTIGRERMSSIGFRLADSSRRRRPRNRDLIIPESYTSACIAQANASVPCGRESAAHGLIIDAINPTQLAWSLIIVPPGRIVCGCICPMGCSSGRGEESGTRAWQTSCWDFAA